MAPPSFTIMDFAQAAECFKLTKESDIESQIDSNQLVPLTANEKDQRTTDFKMRINNHYRYVPSDEEIRRFNKHRNQFYLRGAMGFVVGSAIMWRVSSGKGILRIIRGLIGASIGAGLGSTIGFASVPKQMLVDLCSIPDSQSSLARLFRQSVAEKRPDNPFYRRVLYQMEQDQKKPKFEVHIQIK